MAYQIITYDQLESFVSVMSTEKTYYIQPIDPTSSEAPDVEYAYCLYLTRVKCRDQKYLVLESQCGYGYLEAYDKAGSAACISSLFQTADGFNDIGFHFADMTYALFDDEEAEVLQ